MPVFQLKIKKDFIPDVRKFLSLSTSFFTFIYVHIHVHSCYRYAHRCYIHSHWCYIHAHKCYINAHACSSAAINAPILFLFVTPNRFSLETLLHLNRLIVCRNCNSFHFHLIFELLLTNYNFRFGKCVSIGNITFLLKFFPTWKFYSSCAKYSDACSWEFQFWNGSSKNSRRNFPEISTLEKLLLLYPLWQFYHALSNFIMPTCKMKKDPRRRFPGAISVRSLILTRTYFLF